MATNAGEIEVKLTLSAEDFKRAMQDGKKSVEDFGKNSKSFFDEHKLAIAGALAGITAFAVKSIQAYGEQEMATARLSQALKNQGFEVSNNVREYEALANAIQDKTGADNTAIMSAQAMLTTFGIQGKTMEKVTRAAVDLSAALGIDLQSAAQLLGKAYAGNTAALSRYGIVIDEGLSKSEKFSAVMQQMTRFQGAAEAQGQTFAGQLKILGANFEDLQKSVGALLSGEGPGLIKWINNLVLSVTNALNYIVSIRQQFGSLGDFIKTFAWTILGTVLTTVTILMQRGIEFMGWIHTTVVAGLTAVLGPVVQFIGDMLAKIPVVGVALQGQVNQLFANWQAGMAMISTAHQAAATGVGRVTTAIENQIVSLQSEKINAAQAAGVMVEGEAVKTGAIQEHTQKRMDIEAAMAQWISDKRMMDRDEFLKSLQVKNDEYQKFLAEFKTTTAQTWEEARRVVRMTFDNFGNGINQMIFENKKFSDVIKKIWQDIAKAIISYIAQMIAKWLAFMALKGALSMFGGPVGMAAGTVVGAAAGAQFGGMIGEPSVVTGLRSGKTMLAGEAGPEAIVPVGGNGYFPQSGGGGGGGSITVNISGQFIDGNDASWQRLIRDRIVPEIRRFTMSVPVGPFQRRRGVS